MNTFLYNIPCIFFAKMRLHLDAQSTIVVFNKWRKWKSFELQSWVILNPMPWYQFVKNIGGCQILVCEKKVMLEIRRGKENTQTFIWTLKLTFYLFFFSYNNWLDTIPTYRIQMIVLDLWCLYKIHHKNTLVIIDIFYLC